MRCEDGETGFEFESGVAGWGRLVSCGFTECFPVWNGLVQVRMGNDERRDASRGDSNGTGTPS